MKKLFSIFILLLLGTGCSSSGKITIQKDDFKKTISITMTYPHNSVEKKEKSSKSYRSMTSYSREIKDQRKGPATITFVIEAPESLDTIKKEGFVRVNRNTFPLVFSDISTELKTTTTASMKTRNKTTAKSVTRQWKILRGTATLPLKVEEEILRAKVFAYRLYVDKKPITFIVKRDDLKKIREFLNTNALKKK